MAAAMVGAAAGLGGAGAAAGPGMEAIEKLSQAAPNSRTDLPHWVLVAVTSTEARVIGSDRHALIGPRLATYEHDNFDATVHRYPGEVDLTLDSPTEGRMGLRGKKSVFRRSCVRTAAAAARLARRR